MAKAPTEEQSLLKRRARRRLVGSIALVTVIAVVLPWVLEHEPRPSEQQIAIQIPSPNSGKFEPKQPAPAPTQASPEVKPEAAPPLPSEKPPSVETPAAAPSTPVDDGLRAEQAKVLSPPAKPSVTKAAPAKESKEREKDKAPVEKKKAAAEKAEAAPEAKAAADAKPYVVQVAALADAEKAAEIQKSMAAKGLKVYTEKVKTASGEVTRVRVGPFPSRDAAEKERGRMKSLGFDGNVAPK